MTRRLKLKQLLAESWRPTGTDAFSEALKRHKVELVDVEAGHGNYAVAFKSKKAFDSFMNTLLAEMDEEDFDWESEVKYFVFTKPIGGIGAIVVFS